MNITNTMLWMKKEAYEPTTIKRVAKELRHLERNCNTSDPEDVKLYIAEKKCSNARKENLVEAYNLVIQSLGLTWTKPFYQRYDKKRRAPKEELVNFIIDHCRLEMAVKLSISKDLGQRPQELCWLTLKDIDLTTGATSITGAKHTIGREGKLRAKSLKLLKLYIEKKNLNSNSHLWNGTSDNLSNNYRQTRNRIAKDFNMPELKQVQLYDFRRFKASKTYHISGHNFLLVKELLGHKDSRSTEKYISLFNENLTWIPVVCTTEEEIKQAIQDDCILVCQADGKTFFKKPA
jgi:integrase